MITLRKQLTTDQEQTLIKSFKAKPYLKRKEKEQLARSLNITEEKITRWYIRRRHLRKRAGLLNTPKSEKYSTIYAIIHKSVIPYTNTHTDIYTHTYTQKH